MNRNRYLQQQTQGAELENQQRQIQLEQSRALMDTAKGIDWTQDDAFEKFLSNAQSSGKVNPQTFCDGATASAVQGTVSQNRYSHIGG